MKRLMLLAVLLSVAASAKAATLTDPTIWRSSYVASGNQTTTNLALPRNGCKFHGVVVSSGATGVFTLYDSSAQAANVVTTISKSAPGSYFFDVRLSSGCTYSNTGTSPVTILYAPLF